MAFLFPRNKQRVTVDLVRTAKELLQKLSAVDQVPSAAEDALAQKLSQMKLILQGTQETETSPEQVYQLITLLLSEDILYLLATNLAKIPFEGRKDTQFIFSACLRYKNPSSPNAAEPIALHYLLSSRPQTIVALCNGYDRRESAMPCGSTIREALKFDAVAALILYDEPSPDGRGRNLEEVDTSKESSGQGVFWKFFDWIVKSSFDVCADAFSTFRVRSLLENGKQETDERNRISSRSIRVSSRHFWRPISSSSSPNIIACSYNQTTMSLKDSQSSS